MPFLHDSLTSVIHLAGTLIPLTMQLLETNIFVVPRQRTFPHPTPPFNRIFIFLTGGCLVDTGSAQYRLEPGSVYLLPTEQSFDGTFDSGTQMLFFHLRLEHLTGMDVFRGMSGVVQLPLPAAVQSTLKGAVQPGDLAETLYWESLLFHQLCRCLQGLPAQHLQCLIQGTQRQHQVLSYIQQCGSPALTVGDCADHLGVTCAALSKAFRRDMGLPLKTYLQRTYLAQACRLLCQSDLTVKEIAQEVGYEDIYYFHRLFKRQIGETPVAYRRLMREIQTDHDERSSR